MADIDFEQAFTGGCDAATLQYIVGAIVLVATILVLYYVVKVASGSEGMTSKSSMYAGHNLQAKLYQEGMANVHMGHNPKQRFYHPGGMASKSGEYAGHNLQAKLYQEGMTGKSGEYAGHNLQAQLY